MEALDTVSSVLISKLGALALIRPDHCVVGPLHQMFRKQGPVLWAAWLLCFLDATSVTSV